MDIVNAINEYESGELDQVDTVELFQHLVDTGLAWSLQGHYGRTAMSMIHEGIVSVERVEIEEEKG